MKKLVHCPSQLELLLYGYETKLSVTVAKIQQTVKLNCGSLLCLFNMSLQKSLVYVSGTVFYLITH